MQEQKKNLRKYIIPAMISNAAFFITFLMGRPTCVLFGADASAVSVVVDALPKYCLNFVFATASAIIASYLFSTKRTQYAIALNASRSKIFNFLCINFLPLLFGQRFVWYTVAVAEGICLVLAVTLWKYSERNGIIHH